MNTAASPQPPAARPIDARRDLRMLFVKEHATPARIDLVAINAARAIECAEHRLRDTQDQLRQTMPIRPRRRP